MARALQIKIGTFMIAIAVIAYFCAYPELAVLLGILVATLAFVSPVFVMAYLICRYMRTDGGPSTRG